MKYIIKNGYIIDGTGNEGYFGDILIENDNIIKIGKIGFTNYNEVENIFDASGKVVCPGFIDTHSHSDLNLLLNPGLLPKISQGITTEILGQDGISVAPVTKEYLSIWRKNVSGLLGDINDDWNWNSVDEYLRLVQSKNTSTNILYLVPHGNIRMLVMGLEGRNATMAEVQKMKDILRDCLEQGCYGMSTGLIYPPCVYADENELMSLCKVLARKNSLFVVHQRSESDNIINSLKELINLGIKTGVKIHISHFKLAGRKNWKLLDRLFSLLDKAEREGVDISFDQYPYNAGSTMLSVILPPWVQAGGSEYMLKRLQDSVVRDKIKIDIKQGIEGWDNFIDFAGYDGIYITDTKNNKEVIGKNLIELSKKYGCDPIDAVCNLLIEEENQVSIVDFYGNEENLIRIMRAKKQNFCTDGLLGGKPHPRVYGTFPRVLGFYVREKKVLSIFDAIKKMTSIPAERFNIKHRGLLKEGFKADIVIFDRDTIKDKATYDDPVQLSEGIDWVFVNGNPVYHKGKINQNRSGSVLRRFY